MVIKKQAEKKKKPTQQYPVKYGGIVKINEKKLVDDFVCEKCLLEIKPNSRFVFLGTYELKKREKENLDVGLVSEHLYHLPCWIEYFNLKVIEKLTQSQKNAMELMKNHPVFENLIKNAQLLKI